MPPGPRPFEASAGLGMGVGRGWVGGPNGLCLSIKPVGEGSPPARFSPGSFPIQEWWKSWETPATITQHGLHACPRWEDLVRKGRARQGGFGRCL